MREVLRQQQPAKDEQQPKPQHTQGGKYKEQSRRDRVSNISSPILGKGMCRILKWRNYNKWMRKVKDGVAWTVIKQALESPQATRIPRPHPLQHRYLCDYRDAEAFGRRQRCSRD
jgi:hypothetical protein